MHECELHKFSFIHGGVCCQEDYYNNLIETIKDDMEIIDILKKKRGERVVVARCIKCGTIRKVQISDFFERKQYHNRCIMFLPNDEIKETLMRRWYDIEQRTSNPNHNHYNNYGGRGIKNEFKDFVEFYYNFYDDLKNDINLTIDRINVDGNYNKENTRLISHKNQQSNKTNTRYFIGEKHGKKFISNNALEFGNHFNINGRSVGNCLRGKSKTAGGWKFNNISKELFEELTKDCNEVIIIKELNDDKKEEN